MVKNLYCNQCKKYFSQWNEKIPNSCTLCNSTKWYVHISEPASEVNPIGVCQDVIPMPLCISYLNPMPKAATLTCFDCGDSFVNKNSHYRCKFCSSCKEIRQINSAQKLRYPDVLGSFTGGEWKSLLVKAGHQCLRCKAFTHLCVDHIIPLSRGGTNFVDNLQPLCKSCNSKKSDSSWNYWTGNPGPFTTRSCGMCKGCGYTEFNG